MSALSVYAGQPIDIVGTFRDRAGALQDPPDVTVTLRPPRGTVVTVTLADDQVKRDGLGVFRYTVKPAVSGTWSYRMAGAFPVDGVVEGTFTVHPTAF